MNELLITGKGTIAGGEYSDIIVNGIADTSGNIKCNDLKASGTFSTKSNIDAQSEIKTMGFAKIIGDIKAKALHTMGKFSSEGSIVADNITVSGLFSSKKKIKATKVEVTGTLTSHSDIEAETFNATGTVNCNGLINAETFNLKMETKNMRIDSIGGGLITVYPGYTDNALNKIGVLNKILKVINSPCKLIIKESIEGDIVNIESTEAPLVCGRIVIIGEGSKIKTVQYSEKLEIHDGATVLEQIKV